MALKMFKTFRIRSEEMLQDTLNFLIDKFKQARKQFTVSSVYGQLLFVMDQLSQFYFYFIEDSITELNINEATRNSSKYSLISLAGYNPSRSMAASGEIKIVSKKSIPFEVASNIIVIPTYSRLSCNSNGKTYSILLPNLDIRLPLDGTTAVVIPIVQGRIETQFFTGNGKEFPSISVPFPKNYFVDQYMFDVYVNDTKWTRCDNLLRMPRGEGSYMARTGVTSGIDIFFGNKTFGAYPALGDEIRVEYLITDGFSGRVSANKKEDVTFTFIDTGFSLLGEEIDLNQILDVSTTLVPDFGSNPEPIEMSVLLMSKSNTSLVRLDNYEAMAKRFDYFSIVKVFQDINDERVVNLFLVPDISKTITTNQTYFNIPLSSFTLTEEKKNHFLSIIEKMGTKLIATDVKIIDPAISKYVINVGIIIFEGYNADVIKNNIIHEMSDYFLTINRRTRIPRSDLIRVIEGIDGVDSVNVSIISEKNELSKIANPNAPDIGTDGYNDIIMLDNELPVVRGGWQDRYGNIYSEGLSTDGLGALNIRVSDIIEKK